jgi:ABC-type dipeptide/oligopeptide/nickel transport system permease component
MASFILRRVFWTVPTLFLVVTLLFFMMRGIGGDPLRPSPLLGLASPAWSKSGDPKPESIERNMARVRGLDRPLYEQYGRYLRSVATLDFGNTFSFRYRTVNSILKRQGLVSLELGLLALGWALTLGVPLGMVGALRAGTKVDGASRTAATVAYAVPNFLVGTILVYVVAVKWGLLRTSGWEDWRAKLLPSFTLGLFPAGVCARLLRAGMVETLQLDYVRTAAAKGLRRSRIVSAHVLRNSLIPVLTALGPLVGYLVTGSFIVEYVFAIPGIGRYFVAAVLARDYPLVLGITVVLTVAIVLANLLVDVLHAALDPRVREARA